MSSKLGELILDEIESKLKVDARGMTWSQSWNPNSEYPSIRGGITRDPKRRSTRKIQICLKVQCNYASNFQCTRKNYWSQVIAQGLQRSVNDYHDRCKWRYSPRKRSCNYILQEQTMLSHLKNCGTRTTTAEEPHFGPSTCLKRSYNTHTDGQVHHLWKTGTRDRV